MGIEIEPPIKIKKARGLFSFLEEEGPIRKLIREWKPILPREKFFGEKTAIYPPTDSMIESMREAKKREWLAKGYPEGLVEKALLLADRWVSELAATYAPPDRPDIREAIIRHAYPMALSVGERWIEAMMK